MKKPRISMLFAVALCTAAFTMGLFIGRNYCGKPMTLSIPEEIRLPAPSSSPNPNDVAGEAADADILIDINTASQFELTALPGIGEGLAAQIIAYREVNGSYSHVEQLMNVPGIGESRLEAILSMITVGGTK